MGEKRSSLVLPRLKAGIQKVKFLLSTNLAQWLYIGSAVSATRRRSFKNQPGLLDAVSEASSGEYYDAGSRSGSPAPGVLSRTTSSLRTDVSRSPGTSAPSTSRTASDASEEEDVDKRAEAFIENFWRHIQMERQISLELRYCKSDSLERTGSS